MHATKIRHMRNIRFFIDLNQYSNINTSKLNT